MNRSKFLILAGVLFISVIVMIAAWPKNPTDKSLTEHFGRRLSLSERRLSELSQEVLASPDTFYLYSIDPEKFIPGTNGPTQEHFQHYKILGRLEITKKEQQATLISALNKGLAEARNVHLKCFDPRHGITAIKGTNKIELLICFQCLSGYELTPECPEYLSRGCRAHQFSISNTPRDTFNDVLKQANIPLPKEW